VVEEGASADQGDRGGELEKGGADEPAQEGDQVPTGGGEAAVRAQVRAHQARRRDVPEQDVQAEDVQEQSGQATDRGHGGQPKGEGAKGDLLENRDSVRRRKSGRSARRATCSGVRVVLQVQGTLAGGRGHGKGPGRNGCGR